MKVAGVLWDIPFTMSSPYILRAGDYMAVADRLGTGRVVNSKRSRDNGADHGESDSASLRE